MKINIYNHAVDRYRERIDERKTPEGVYRFLQSIVRKEAMKQQDKRRIVRLPREVHDKNGRYKGTYMYFYLKCVSPFGIPFYLSVDNNLTTVYTVLNEEQFNRTLNSPKALVE